MGQAAAKLEKAGADFIEVMIPSKEDVEIVNSVIYNELCLGEIKDATRESYKRIIAKMAEDGAEGVILGVRR